MRCGAASGGRTGNSNVTGKLLGQRALDRLYNKLIKSIV